MFEVEKPRRFHYEPRFYDPEKEKWEALKLKYAVEQERKREQEAPTGQPEENADGEADLEYFRRRVRQIDREAAAQSSKFTWRDMFRKREMPKFNYQPRFGSGGVSAGQPAETSEPSAEGRALADKYRESKRRIKIKRRFDMSDSEYMKPVSGTKIIFYCLIVFILITLIVRF